MYWKLSPFKLSLVKSKRLKHFSIYGNISIAWLLKADIKMYSFIQYSNNWPSSCIQNWIKNINEEAILCLTKTKIGKIRQASWQLLNKPWYLNIRYYSRCLPITHYQKFISFSFLAMTTSSCKNFQGLKGRTVQIVSAISNMGNIQIVLDLDYPFPDNTNNSFLAPQLLSLFSLNCHGKCE